MPSLTSKRTAYVLFGLAWVALAVGFWAYVFHVLAKCGFGPGLADYDYQLTTSCRLSRSSAHEIVVICDDGKSATSTDAEIYKVGWNDKFLIAATHPVSKRAYPDNPNNTYMVPDESVIYWWIIDLKSNRNFGPLSESEFERQEAKLSVAPAIPLLSIDQAKIAGVGWTAISKTPVNSSRGNKRWHEYHVPAPLTHTPDTAIEPAI